MTSLTDKLSPEQLRILNEAFFQRMLQSCVTLRSSKREPQMTFEEALQFFIKDGQTDPLLDQLKISSLRPLLPGQKISPSSFERSLEICDQA